MSRLNVTFDGLRGNQDGVSMLLVFNIKVLQFLFRFTTIITKIKFFFYVFLLFI